MIVYTCGISAIAVSTGFTVDHDLRVKSNWSRVQVF
jgi:hypothetical protein